MPRYVIYARKSTESEDRQVLSIDSQIKELRQIAGRQGLDEPEVLTESHSAKAPGRPIFSTLMRRIERGDVQGILTWKWDRLSRNHMDTGRLLQALADGCLERVITPEKTHTGSGSDRFMSNFELAVASKFIDDLRENVCRGIRARFEQGWCNFVPPLGYLNDRVTKTIVKDPDRFDLVRRMWDLYLTGTMRPAQILKIANDDWGLRTRQFRRRGGKQLWPSALYRVLGNPFYMGIIQLRDGRRYVGNHPAMVSKAEFDRAQELLGGGHRERPRSHDFAFTGIFRCGNCGAMVTAEEHIKKRGKRYVYYRCTHRRSGASCKEQPIPESDLKAQIDSQLGRLSMPAPILEWLLQKARTSIEGDLAQASLVRKTLEDALAGVQREADNLLALRLRDQVDDAVFAREKARHVDRRQSLEQRLALPRHSEASFADAAVKTLNFAATAQDVFTSGTAVQQRMILQAVGLNWTLRGRKVALELKKPLSIIADAGSFSNWCSIGQDVRTLIDELAEFWVPDLGGVSAADIQPLAA